LSAQKQSKAKGQPKTEAVDWGRLATADPSDVCQRTEAVLIPGNGGYALTILNRKYRVVPQEQKFLSAQGDSWVREKLRDHFQLMVLRYLLDAQRDEPTGTWIGAQDLKGGPAFFRGPYALPVKDLEKAFGKDPEAFWQAGRLLGGMELLFGDKAFALTVFPKVPMGYVLWKEGEEVPPRITVMFDSTVQKHFALDGIWAMVDEVSRRLLEIRKL
jgi:hypothetical protein